jgi:hypothetical protein
VRHGPRRISSGGFSLQAPGAKTAPWLLSSRRGGEIRLALPPDLSRRSGRGLACPGNRINDLGNGCRIGLLRRRHHNRSQAAAAPLQEAMPRSDDEPIAGLSRPISGKQRGADGRRFTMDWFGVRHGSHCLWRDGLLSWPFTAAEYAAASFARQGRELADLMLRPARGAGVDDPDCIVAWPLSPDARACGHDVQAGV